MSADFKPTPHYIDECTLFNPAFPDTCVKHSFLRDIAASVPGKSAKDEFERIFYAMASYPITAHELRDFLGCERPEMSIRRFAATLKKMAKVTSNVTDENGDLHSVSAYTLQPERAIGWEKFGRHIEPAELDRIVRDMRKKAETAKA